MSKKISELTTAETLTGTEEVPLTQSGLTKKVTINDLFNPIPFDQTTGSEEVTNGTFNGNADGWEGDGDPLPTGNWAYGTNNVIHTPGSHLTLDNDGEYLKGATYNVIIQCDGSAGTLSVQIAEGGYSTPQIINSPSTLNLMLVAGIDGSYLQIKPSDDFDGNISSVSAIRQAKAALITDGIIFSNTTNPPIGENIVANRKYVDSKFQSGVTAGPFTVITSITVVNGLITDLQGT